MTCWGRRNGEHVPRNWFSGRAIKNIKEAYGITLFGLCGEFIKESSSICGGFSSSDTFTRVMEIINIVGQLYFKNLRKQQKRRSAERKREECDRKDSAEQSDAQCSGNQDLVKYCTVTTKVGKADKMKIDHITEPPAKSPEN